MTEPQYWYGIIFWNGREKELHCKFRATDYTNALKYVRLVRARGWLAGEIHFIDHWPSENPLFGQYDINLEEVESVLWDLKNG